MTGQYLTLGRARTMTSCRRETGDGSLMDGGKGQDRDGVHYSKFGDNYSDPSGGRSQLEWAHQ